MKWTVILAALGASAVVAVTASAQSAPPTKEAGKLIVGFDLPAPGFWNGQGVGDDHQEPIRLRVRALAGDREAVEDPGGRVPARALRRPLLACAEEVRLRVRGGHDHGRAEEGRRLLHAVLRRESGRPHSQGHCPSRRRVAALKSLQTCAQKDTTGLSYIQHKLRPAKKPLVYSASSTAAFDAVEAGRCDALILDVPIVVSQSKKKPGAYGGVAGQIVTNEFYGAVMEKGSKFKPFLDKAIGTLRANGTITRLQKKWLPFTRVPVLK